LWEGRDGVVRGGEGEKVVELAVVVVAVARYLSFFFIEI